MLFAGHQIMVQFRYKMHELHWTNNNIFYTLIVSTNRYLDHLRLFRRENVGGNLTAGFIYNSLKNKHKSRSEKFLFSELLLALRDCDNRAFRSCCCWWNQRRWRLCMMPMIPSHAMYWEHKDHFIRTRVRSLFYPYY